MKIKFDFKGKSIFSRLPYFSVLFFILTISLSATDIDIDKLLQVAKKQNRDIMFFHHIPGCPYCKTMIDENFKDETILKEIKTDFIYVDIYTADKGTIKFRDFKGTHKEFSAYLGAFVYPSTIFMDSEGEVVHKAIGYRNIDEYFAEIKYVSSKSYTKISLEEFSNNLEFKKDD